MVASPGFIFSPTGAGGLPTYEELDQRRRIAAAMVSKRNPYPKNIGEGLAAIGDAIGDRGYMSALSDAEKAQREYQTGQMAGATEGPAPSYTRYDPGYPKDDEPTSLPPTGTTTPAPTTIGPRTEDAPGTTVAADATEPRSPFPAPNTPTPRERISQTIMQQRGQAPSLPALGAAGTAAATASPAAAAPQQMAALGDRGGAGAVMSDADPVNPAPMGAGAGGPPLKPPPIPTQPIAGMLPTNMGVPGAMFPGQAPAPAALPVQTAQATPAAVPGTTSDIRPAPALPVIPKPLGAPRPPQMMPDTNPQIQRLDAIANDPRLDPAARSRAAKMADSARGRIKAANDQQMSEYNVYLQQHLTETAGRRDPTKIYAQEKARRELEGEGFFPIPPDKLKQFPPFPAGVTPYMDRWGNLKTVQGPASISVDTGSKQETKESEERGKLAAQREGELMQTANRAGSQLVTINRAEALLDRITTGKLEPTKMTMGMYAQAIGIPPEVLTKLGFRPDQAGSQEAFQAIVNELTIGKIGSGGFPANNFSKTDLDFLMQTAPGMADTPEGNRIKLAAARIMAQRDMEKARDWAAYRRNPENKGKSFADFEFDFHDKVSQTDLTGDLRRQADEAIARARMQSGPPAVATPPPNALPAETRGKWEQWLLVNPNHPDAAAIRQELGR